MLTERPVRTGLPESLGQQSASGWYDRYRQWYTSTLASDRFRSWAARLPFTRPVARRHAARLFDLCAGFVHSQVLLPCVRLDLLTVLAQGSLRMDEIATRTGLLPERAQTLVRAAMALQLVEDRGAGRYGLGPCGAVVHGDAGITAMIRHHELVYRDLADPVALLRGAGDERDTGLSDFWPYAAGAEPPAAGRTPAASAPPCAGDGDAIARYSALMSASVPAVAEQLLGAYPLARHRRLLDVGGGDGSLARLVARAVPQLQITVFDLAEVVARAATRNAAEGLSQQVDVAAGDFRRDALPAGHDVVTLVRVTFDHDDATVLDILGNVRAALQAGATLLIVEPLSGSMGCPRVSDAYFGPYLLAMGRGRPRSVDEHARLLRRAGFAAPRRLATPMPVHADVLMARAA